jgi:hypothetical protein
MYLHRTINKNNYIYKEILFFADWFLFNHAL